MRDEDEAAALRRLSAKLAIAIVETTDMAGELMKFCDDEDTVQEAISRMVRISSYIARAQREAGLSTDEPKKGIVH